MMTIEELLTPVTTAQQEESFLATLEGIGVPARSWRAGGSLRTILHIVAAVYAGFSTSILGFVRAGFLETATGGWLTLLAFNVYGVTRIDATFASGQIQLTNGGGGIYTSVAVGALTVTSPTTGKAYTNTSVFTLNPGDTILVNVQAVEQGSSSSAPPATVTTLVTVLHGVTVTNPASIVGSNAEEDPDLRQRCKDKLSIISGRGPRGAYDYAVRSAIRGDGSPVNINRKSISPSSSTGVVTIYVASPSGAPDPADLPYIVTSIETYARPDTVTANVLGANPVAFSKALTVWAKRHDGVSAVDLATLVGNALTAMVSTYPIGGIAKPPSTQGYLYGTTIEGTAESAHPSIFAIDGVGSDLAMSPGDVATLATTLTIRIVDVT
jgi:hypothetical protein